MKVSGYAVDIAIPEVERIEKILCDRIFVPGDKEYAEVGLWLIGECDRLIRDTEETMEVRRRRVNPAKRLVLRDRGHHPGRKSGYGLGYRES